MPRLKDLTSKKFGRLTVLKRLPNNNHNQVVWMCLCECGVRKPVLSGSILSGSTRSCGCLQSEITARRSSSHLHSKRNERSPTYNSWALMIQRCTNPNNKRWKNYGGRGISVCRRWFSFEAFLEDMGDRPNGFSIERKNNNGNYTPKNCIWIPMKSQVLNRTDTLAVVIDGERLPAAVAARKIGVPWRTFTRHVHKYGPSKAVEMALKRTNKTS